MPIPAEQRKRPVASFTLSHEALGAVAELMEAWGVSKSAVVEQLIRREARREGLDLKALGRKERRRRRS